MQKVWAEHALTPNGWQNDVLLNIDDEGRIASVIANSAPVGKPVGCLLPAPANAHSHAFQRAMAGLTETRGQDRSDSFWSWRRLMFEFLGKITPDQVQAIAAYVQMEMLEAGYATNVEFHYLHHTPDGRPYDTLAEMALRIIEAARETGIGLTLLPVHYQFGGLDKRALVQGQTRFRTDIDVFAQLAEDCRKAIADGRPDWGSGVAPHSLRAVSTENLKRFVTLFPDGPIHMHLAEQIPEVDEVLAQLGRRPVEWVLDNMDPNDRWHFIHLTQMMPHETETLAQTGATAVLCPITESNLGDGIFDGLRWMDAGGRTAIGSDSNIRISLSEELRTLDYSQRLRDRSRAALATQDRSTGRRIFDAIVKGGAASSGRSTGALQMGHWADLVAFSMEHVDLCGLKGDRILDSFAFARDDRVITDVWSAGRHMVRDGRHINRDAIETSYRVVTKALREDT